MNLPEQPPPPGEFHGGLRSGFGVYLHCESPDSSKLASLEALPSLGPFSWGSHHPFSPRWKAARAGWVYAGQFKLGGRHGLGAQALADGSLYEGQFQDDMQHGFGVCIAPHGGSVSAQVWEAGELRLQVEIGANASFDVHVEVSLNRLRWTPSRMCIRYDAQWGGRGGAIVLLVGSGGDKGLVPPIPAADVLSVRVGDPITHSLVVHFMGEGPGGQRVKKAVEVQAGKEGYFRLLFLALRALVDEAKGTKGFKRPVELDWYEGFLRAPNAGAMSGRCVRGSEGLDERLIGQVRTNVRRAELRLLDAFWYSARGLRAVSWGVGACLSGRHGLRIDAGVRCEREHAFDSWTARKGGGWGGLLEGEVKWSGEVSRGDLAALGSAMAEWEVATVDPPQAAHKTQSTDSQPVPPCRSLWPPPSATCRLPPATCQEHFPESPQAPHPPEATA